jgi:plastocyanin
LKKTLSFFLIVLMISVFLGISSVAFAADISLTVQPEVTEMAHGGNVNFSFTIVNSSGTTLTGYSIGCNGNKVAADDATVLGDGSPITSSFSMNVSDDMLGNTLTFQLYDSGGNAISGASDNVKINKKAQSVKIAASVAPSQTLVSPGDTVTFTFNIENQGEATLDNIVITASAFNNGQPLNNAFSLAPGESKPVTYKHKVTTAVTVEPRISFSANGTAQQPYGLDPIGLTLESRDVEPLLLVDNSSPNAGENVTFTLSVANNGNVPYSNLSVTMNGEEKDFPFKKLTPGDKLTKEYTMSFQTSTEVVFKITMKDHKGQTKSVSTNSVSVKLPVNQNALSQKLMLVMNVDRPQLTSAGTINFSGYVSNASEYSLSDIVVTEGTLGTIFEISSMAPGTKENIDWSADINGTTTYQFVLTAKDETGQSYSVNADPITVAISSAESTTTDFEEAADITETDMLTLDSSKGSIGSLGVWAIIAIVLVVLIIGVGVALLVLWKKGKSPSKVSAAKAMGTKKKVPYRNGYGKRPQNQRSYRDRNNF